MPNAVEITQQLIRCRSITPADDGALDYLETLLSERGFTCHRLRFADADNPEVENLYARIGTAAPNLCFAGHTDVVPPGNEGHWIAPPFAGEVRGDAIYGRGAADMKGGIAAFVAATYDYLDANDGTPPGSISFLITGDEEGPAVNGTAKVLRWMEEHGEKIDHCIVGEPTNPTTLGESIKVGRRGSLSGTIFVRGRQGHVAYPQMADNPVPKLVKLIAHLEAQTLDEGTEHFQPSNLEFVGIETPGFAWNVIPGEARVRFNVRFNDLWTSAKLEKWLAARLDEAADGEFSYVLGIAPTASEAFLNGPCILTDILAEAIKEVTGLTPELSTSGGTSDARFIKAHARVAEFGLVGETMHSIDEHVRVKDLEDLKTIYRKLIDTYFKRLASGAKG